MNETKKLNEAKYFFLRMQQEQDRDSFTYNLSAFLSSSRSVLQYALCEASTKENGSQWYQSYTSANTILKFFKDKRNINIHEKPVSTPAKTFININESLGISDSISVVVRDKNGNIKSQYKSESPIELTNNKPQVTIKVTYEFSEWEGNNKNALFLCQEYLHELEKIVNEGVSKGFITG